MNDTLHNWLDNWEQEADYFFRKLENVPPELEGEVQNLIAWRDKAHDAAGEYRVLREKMWRKRMERRDAEAQIKAISQRQSREVEHEIAEREFRTWQRKIAHIKAEIDRITDKIIRDMRRRHRQQLMRLAVKRVKEAEAIHQQAEEDLLLWESFKLSLEADEPTETALDYAEHQQREQERRQRLKQEYEVFQIREHSSSEEDQATWQAFLEDLDSGVESGFEILDDYD